MYIPDKNKITDRTEAIAFMNRFSFATIISYKDSRPVATHMPFIIDTDSSVTLISHFAKANEHWKHIESQEVLVIFSEPHAYVSPSNYENIQAVPTWNYISVHAYGQGRLINNKIEIFEVLEKSIDSFDADYKKQWNNLPEDFKLKMVNGIVAFKIEVTELQGKKKLSQNKSETEQNNVIHSLSKSDNTSERLIAEYMKKEQEQKGRSC